MAVRKKQHKPKNDDGLAPEGEYFLNCLAIWLALNDDPQIKLKGEGFVVENLPACMIAFLERLRDNPKGTHNALTLITPAVVLRLLRDRPRPIPPI